MNKLHLPIQVMQLKRAYQGRKRDVRTKARILILCLVERSSKQGVKEKIHWRPDAKQ